MSGGNSPPQGPKGRALLNEVTIKSKGLLGFCTPPREREDRPVRIDIFTVLSFSTAW